MREAARSCCSRQAKGLRGLHKGGPKTHQRDDDQQKVVEEKEGLRDGLALTLNLEERLGIRGWKCRQKKE